MPDAKQYKSYMAFRLSENGSVDGLNINENLEVLKAWIAKDPEIDEENEENSNSDEEDILDIERVIPNGINTLFDGYKKSILSYHNIITLTNTLEIIYTDMYLNQIIYTHAAENLNLISEDESSKIFSFGRSEVRAINGLISRLNQTHRGVSKLPSAILLSLVATFDSFFSEILKFFLKLHPERYIYSKKEIKLEEVFRHQSLADVIDHVIDSEVSDLMRGSHSEQVRFIEKNFQISIEEHYPRWPEFIELFERRNIATHGDLRVNRQYVARCADVKLPDIDRLELGEILSLNSEYLINSAEILFEFGFLLTFTLRRKNNPEQDEETFANLNQICYDLIVDKKYILSERILEFALYKQNVNCSQNVKLMMIVNLANTYRKMDKEKECSVLLSETDWSASQERFQICVASLRDDKIKAKELLPKVAATDSIAAQDIRDWPVFDWIRDDEEFVQMFEEVYEEKMNNLTKNSPLEGGAIMESGLASPDDGAGQPAEGHD